MRGTAVATAAMVVVLVVVKLLLGDRLPPASLLVIEVVGGATAFLGVMTLLERSLLAELWTVAGQAVPGLARLQHRIGRP
jgi:hypothetical protein